MCGSTEQLFVFGVNDDHFERGGVVGRLVSGSVFAAVADQRACHQGQENGEAEGRNPHRGIGGFIRDGRGIPRSMVFLIGHIEGDAIRSLTRVQSSSVAFVCWGGRETCEKSSLTQICASKVCDVSAAHGRMTCFYRVLNTFHRCR